MLCTRRSHSWLLLVLLAVLVGITTQAFGTGPVFKKAVFFGGAGDQRGQSAVIRGNGLYITGYDYANSRGLALKYELPLADAPAWANSPSVGLNSGAATDSTTYFFGAVPPTACGVIDNVGGWEAKPILAIYDINGAFISCDTIHLFPHASGSTSFFAYSGGESYYSAVLVESPTSFLYATGYAENCGFGNYVFVIAKYDTTGNLLSAATEPGVTWDGYECMGGSEMDATTQLNGDLYLGGYSSLLGEDRYSSFYLSHNWWDVKAVLMRYDASLNRLWRQRPSDVGPSRFYAVTTLNGEVYAVGNTQGSGSPDGYLIEKYDQAGNRMWSRVTPAAAGAGLTGVTAATGKLYAVGWTKAAGAGGADVALLEIDPATGNTLSTTLYSGAYDDVASAVVTDGTDVYIIGESRSFSNDGNTEGQDDLMVLQYRVKEPATTTVFLISSANA